MTSEGNTLDLTSRFLNRLFCLRVCFKNGLSQVRTAVKRELCDNRKTLVYVHIGKCGGASLRHALNDSPIVAGQFTKILKIHRVKPPVHRRSKYAIVVRNPVQRAISAFNWRYFLVVQDGRQEKRFIGEYEALRKYGTINNLAESLYCRGMLVSQAAEDFEKIHHLRERISFYLCDLIQQLRPDQVQFVFAQETLNQDIAALLKTQNTHEIHRHGDRTENYRKTLSEEGYRNLKCYLRTDYEAIEAVLRICDTTMASKNVLLR